MVTTDVVGQWQALKHTEPAHQDFLNHYLACSKCRPRSDIYCSQGKLLKRIYEGVVRNAK